MLKKKKTNLKFKKRERQNYYRNKFLHHEYVNNFCITTFNDLWNSVHLYYNYVHMHSNQLFIHNNYVQVNINNATKTNIT